MNNSKSAIIHCMCILLDCYTLHALLPVPPPTTPDVQYENTGGTISLTWTQPQDDAVDSYIITSRHTFNDCPEVDDQNIVVTLIGSERAFNLSGVEESSVYTISIIARNRAGDSTPESVTITTSIVGKCMLE